jgi:hypothetical protein
MRSADLRSDGPLAGRVGTRCRLKPPQRFDVIVGAAFAGSGQPCTGSVVADSATPPGRSDGKTQTMPTTSANRGSRSCTALVRRLLKQLDRYAIAPGRLPQATARKLARKMRGDVAALSGPRRRLSSVDAALRVAFRRPRQYDRNGATKPVESAGPHVMRHRFDGGMAIDGNRVQNT